MSAPAQAARSLINAKRYPEAVALVGQALTSAPDDSELHCLLSQAHLGSRNFVEALRAADQGVRCAPQDEWPHRLRSVALRRLDRGREAVVAATEAARLAPELFEARYCLAEAYLSAKKADAAYAQAYEARRLRAEDADVYDLLGRCLIARKMYREAEESFRHALRLDPNDAAAHNNLGVVLNGTGRRVEAVHEFNEAARLDPSFETARRNLYSGTRFLVGGGSVIFLVYLLFRAAVVVNVGRQSFGLALVGLTILLVLIAVWVWRNRLSFTRRAQLPATAIAYYKAENRRLRRANRPVFLLRLASIPVLIASAVLTAVFDNIAIFLAGVAVAFGLAFLSPWAWHRYVRRPE